MNPHFLRRHWALLLLAFGSLFAGQSQAQYLVYRLQFERAGESINYSPYDGGYYVAPIDGGVGSLVLTRTTSGRGYMLYSNFGEVFLALKGNVRKAVLTATAANSVATTTFYAIGDTDDTLDIRTRFSDEAIVATELRGYAVSADSERDLPFSNSSATDIGVAGASMMTAELDRGMTTASVNSKSLNEQVQVVTDLLEKQGYTQRNPQTGEATTTTGGSNGGGNQGGGNQGTGNQGGGGNSNSGGINNPR
jgi:uncharacterized membrane protein YgcG